MARKTRKATTKRAAKSQKKRGFAGMSKRQQAIFTALIKGESLEESE